MTEQELRQLFKNRSNCYADTRSFREDRTIGESLCEEGEVVQAVTEDTFIDILKEADLLKETSVELLFNKLTDEQRLEIMSNYCKYCGCDNPGCQCNNDE